MILIADAGGTKTTWMIVDPVDGVVKEVKTTGINPAVTPREMVHSAIADELFPALKGLEIDEIHYYGAGICSDDEASIVRDELAPLAAGEVTVESDMVGAAVALLGNRPGIAAILGTGSNSCVWDGGQITANIAGLGYILGDEGSGASIGRRFVGDLFTGLMPEGVMEVWNQEVGMSREEVIRRVYREPGANSFLGSLVPMIKRLDSYPEVEALLDDEMERFVTRCISQYKDCERQLNTVGSVGYYFVDYVARAARRHGIEPGIALRDPMPGLIEYFMKRASKK